MSPDRRHAERSHFDFLKDLAFTAARALARHVSSVYAALGLFLTSGIIVAVLFTWAFVKFAGHVQSGGTQAFDDAVLRWMGAHRIGWVESSLLEITSLGTGLVVLVMVGISAMFLALTEHRFSAFLLLVSTAGGIILNNVLKLGFDRPRPQIFEWSTHASSSSFPSGHSMSATIVYMTIAYLAVRLQKRLIWRVLTSLVAALLIVLICGSRLYLGVHYPSDVLAGIVIGVAWTAFCMTSLGVIRVFAKRRPSVLEHERDLGTAEREAKGLPT